jgi:hypothetical protein
VADDDADLRRLYAERMALPSVEHVSEEVWALLASGELPAAERAQAFGHVSRCAECADLYRQVSALREEAPGLGVPVAPPRAASTPRPARWLFAGAAAAAAVVVALLWTPALPPGPPGSLPPDQDLRQGGAGGPVPLAPRGPLTGPAAAFRWEAVPDTRAYRVELLTTGSEVVWSSGEVHGTETGWPPGLKPAPGRYYWHVGAIPSWSAAAADVVWSPLVEIELPR